MRQANRQMPKKLENETWSDYLRRNWGEVQWQSWRASYFRGTPVQKTQSQKMIDAITKARAEWDADISYQRSVFREYYNLD